MSRSRRFGVLALLGLTIGFLLLSSVSQAEEGREIVPLIPVLEHSDGSAVSTGPGALPATIASVPTHPKVLCTGSWGTRSTRSEVSPAPSWREERESPGVFSHRVVATIPLTPGVGLGPVDIAADPNSALVYIAHAKNRDIAVFSGTEALGMLPIGPVSEGENGWPWYSVQIGVHPTRGWLYTIEGGGDRCYPLRKRFITQVFSNPDVPSATMSDVLSATLIPLISCELYPW